jgi:hypothetical protein
MGRMAPKQNDGAVLSKLDSIFVLERHRFRYDLTVQEGAIGASPVGEIPSPGLVGDKGMVIGNRQVVLGVEPHVRGGIPADRERAPGELGP